jgi:hypothetical protein
MRKCVPDGKNWERKRPVRWLAPKVTFNSFPNLGFSSSTFRRRCHALN